MSGPRTERRWSAILAWAALLLIAGAVLATWGLAHWRGAAQFLGVAERPQPALAIQPAPPTPPLSRNSDDEAAAETRIAALEARLNNVEQASQRAAGSVGRADALLVAFAARRAIDRGVALGYLEPLLQQRFGAYHPRAVATIVTFSRDPETLDTLTSDYRELELALRRGPPGESLWSGIRRELGSLIAVHRSNAPSPMAEARYDRALSRLQQGQVDAALAETMRLPGAARAQEWIVRARRYVAAQRALDEIESAALLARA